MQQKLHPSPLIVISDNRFIRKLWMLNRNTLSFSKCYYLIPKSKWQRKCITLRVSFSCIQNLNFKNMRDDFQHWWLTFALCINNLHMTFDLQGKLTFDLYVIILYLLPQLGFFLLLLLVLFQLLLLSSVAEIWYHQHTSEFTEIHIFFFFFFNVMHL